MYIPKEKYNFTPEQELMVAKYHDFLLHYMRIKKLNDDYYFELALALLETVKITEKKIELKTDIDIKCFLLSQFKHARYSHWIYNTRKKRKPLLPNLSYDALLQSDCTDILKDKEKVETKIENRLFIRDILESDITSKKEKMYVKYLIQGMSINKIAITTMQPYNTVYNQIRNLRKNIKDYYFLGLKPPIISRITSDYVFCPACHAQNIDKRKVYNTESNSFVLFQCRNCERYFSIPKSILNNKELTKTFLKKKIQKKEFVFCPVCFGNNIILMGKRAKKNGFSIRYQCKDCNKIFSIPDSILNNKELTETFLKKKSIKVV